MKNYSIMPLHDAHVEEICQDIREQYETGVATMALFKMTLVPEGDPIIDKAAILCRQYEAYRDRLAEMGCQSGILVQATIGHGYPLNQMFHFQRYIGLADGQKESICCPYDESFRQHMKHQFRTLALHRPAEIMVDDDLRLIHRPGKGCACPLHMAAFNRKAGTNLTREQLYAHIMGNSVLDKHYTDIFVETQKEAVVGAAKAMREGIDCVNPMLPGSFCSSGEAAEFGVEIGAALAGQGNPVVVRINNSNYHAAGARRFANSMMKAAIQIAAIDGRADYILAETDTCPQNRYSTSAYQLHSHFTGSILEGVSGAKHWISRFECFEPGSGKAYRDILAKHRGFYEVLSELTPMLTWHGCRIPVSKVPDYGLQNPNIWELENDGWVNCVLERLGLPMFFSARQPGAVFLDGFGDWRFSDEEILEFFRGPVFLASDTAQRLNARGFRDYTGVDILSWIGRQPSREHLGGDRFCALQKNIRELRPISDKVRAVSMVYHLHNGEEKQDLFPGVTVFDNPAGGKTVVFCGTPQAAFHYTEGFSFLNESRKAQLADLLKECGELPVYYPGDAEVYFRAANLPDGTRFCAFFNIGLDPIEEIALVTEQPVSAVEKLTADGRRVPCRFEAAENGIRIFEAAHTLDPVILFLT